MERKRTNKAYVDEENQRAFIDADPEEIARRKFANAKAPDPLKRKSGRHLSRRVTTERSDVRVNPN